jgi:hypothetical protein
LGCSTSTRGRREFTRNADKIKAVAIVMAIKTARKFTANFMELMAGSGQAILADANIRLSRARREARGVT